MLIGARLGLFGGTGLSPNITSCCLMTASNLSSKLMLELVVELDVYGDDLWMCFRECDWSGFGPCGSWFKAKMKLALIPKLMYLSR